MNLLLAGAIACNLTLWPGFDPCSVPLATFDGTRTTLERHPSPPPEFTKSGERWTYEGRHPAVTANSSTPIGGVLTATVLPGAGTATIAHEMFHVFQRTKHPDWIANEGDLFAYPVERDHDLVRLELEALSRALRDGSAESARLALAVRRARFAALDEAAIAYERKSELNEGLATYVGHRAAGTPDDAIVPERRFAPEEVRDRLYVTGAAYARLLDRHHPEWRETLERAMVPLDEILANAIADSEAARLVDGYRARLDAQRSAFLAAPGWAIRILPKSPLFPAGFDPLNVRLVAKGEVLHTRFVKLAGEAGTLDAMNRAVLTTAAGEHPIFQGVKEIVITGLADEPRIARDGDVTVIDADGVQARIAGTVTHERR